MAHDDWFTRGFGAATTDVRQKLIEEAWFGKVVTPRHYAEAFRPPTEKADKADKSAAEQLGWERADARERDQDKQPDREHGIDR